MFDLIVKIFIRNSPMSLHSEYKIENVDSEQAEKIINEVKKEYRNGKDPNDKKIVEFEIDDKNY